VEAIFAFTKVANHVVFYPAFLSHFPDERASVTGTPAFSFPLRLGFPVPPAQLAAVIESTNDKVVGFGLTLVGAGFAYGVQQNIVEMFFFLPIALIGVMCHVPMKGSFCEKPT
jgi:hypothetical protein